MPRELRRLERTATLLAAVREPLTRIAERGDVAMETPDGPGGLLGTMVTETLEYDGGRSVTVYRPPGTPDAVLFAGDGQLVQEWAIEVEKAGHRSTSIVGVHRAGDEEVR